MMNRKKIIQLKVMVVIGILIGAPFIMGLVNWLSNDKTTCIFDALGFQCLGCNILGALHQIKQGQFIMAFYQNPLVYIWISVGGLIVINELYASVKRMIDRAYEKDSLLEWLLKKMFKGYL